MCVTYYVTYCASQYVTHILFIGRAAPWVPSLVIRNLLFFNIIYRQGLSLKTQQLYAIVFGTRLLFKLAYEEASAQYTRLLRSNSKAQ